MKGRPMRAIISVANREGIVALGRELQTHGFSIFSTSGTASVLQKEGIDAQAVSSLTGFPEILDGRIKTLHPAIFAGILAQRDKEAHMRELQEHDFASVDIVAVNLYPFVKTVARKGRGEQRDAATSRCYCLSAYCQL